MGCCFVARVFMPVRTRPFINLWRGRSFLVVPPQRLRHCSKSKKQDHPLLETQPITPFMGCCLVARAVHARAGSIIHQPLEGTKFLSWQQSILKNGEMGVRSRRITHPTRNRMPLQRSWRNILCQIITPDTPVMNAGSSVRQG